jgi:hypothetical protein
VTDLTNGKYFVADTAENKRVISIYLYNHEKETGILKAFELKKENKKIRGFFMDIRQAAEQAREEIENEVRFVKIAGG